MRHRVFLLLITLLSASSILADAGNKILTGTAALDAFTYQGKPIHPFCLTAFGTPAIDLDTCNNSAVKIDQQGLTLSADSPHKPDEPYAGYVDYSVIAKQADRFLVDILEGDGGTGIFTRIAWIKLNQNQLQIENSGISTGDRCNGGLGNIELKNAQLQYTRHITPSNLIELSGQTNRVIPYETLESSALSCVAQAHYSYTLQTGNQRLESVTLGDDFATITAQPGQLIEDRIGWTERYTAQHCFNQLFNRYVAQGKTQLNQRQLQQFGKDFVTECLP